VTGRDESLFAQDFAGHRSVLSDAIGGRSVLVIGGAGTIGASFIRQLVQFEPRKLTVLDVNENGLAELVRDLRSTHRLPVPEDMLTLPIDFGHPLARRAIREEGPFDIVANFAALKHVRTEKNAVCCAYMIENNLLKTWDLLELLSESPPQHFFSVSTDKATNPINVMGASKKLMEEAVLAWSSEFKTSTARFANVAFSNGSLLDGYCQRLNKQQPLASPNDIRRYFLSIEEAGQLCLLACITGNASDIFTPRLTPDRDLHKFTDFAVSLLDRSGYTPLICDTEAEARERAADSQATGNYPCYFFKTDTTGEKMEEEFYAADEVLNEDRYAAIRVVRYREQPALTDLRGNMQQLRGVISDASVTKAGILAALRDCVQSFEHTEKNKYLDQRM
jgi:FlaA1/EpsC-like NDP-sugar epimerase